MESDEVLFGFDTEIYLYLNPVFGFKPSIESHPIVSVFLLRPIQFSGPHGLGAIMSRDSPIVTANF